MGDACLLLMVTSIAERYMSALIPCSGHASDGVSDFCPVFTRSEKESQIPSCVLDDYF